MVARRRSLWPAIASRSCAFNAANGSLARTINEHCENHLKCPGVLPVHCEHFTYSKAIASPGYCLFGFGDEELSAASRMRQFPSRGVCRDHIDMHFEGLEKRETISVVTRVRNVPSLSYRFKR